MVVCVIRHGLIRRILVQHRMGYCGVRPSASGHVNAEFGNVVIEVQVIACASVLLKTEQVILAGTSTYHPSLADITSNSVSTTAVTDAIVSRANTVATIISLIYTAAKLHFILVDSCLICAKFTTAGSTNVISLISVSTTTTRVKTVANTMSMLTVSTKLMMLYIISNIRLNLQQ